MKILLVEDSEDKAGQVSSLLESVIPGVNIDRAKSFRGGVQKLEACAYDLLLLDMMLPIRDGETPVKQGGRNVLSEVLDGSGCRRPSHIICLTAFHDIVGEFRDEAEKKLVHVVVYDEESTKWRAMLTEKARQIEARILEADTFPKDFKIDVAVVTSSPSVELQEVLRLSCFVGEYNQQDVLHYYSSSWTTTQNENISVIACAAPSMGMTAACVTACKVIERWRPRFLIMTGIAAGTGKEQKYGDVLIAEAAYDYGSGKITETENGERIFTPSYCQIRIEPALHALLQRWERDQIQTDVIRRAWQVEMPSPPRLILGLLASGAAVVQSKDLVEDILSKSRKVVGLDMEGYGIFHAAHLATSPRPNVLIAKSVSDFADNRKDDKWQQYAAFTSAHFIYEFFTKEVGLKFGK